MRRDDLFLEHILDSINAIEAFTEGVNRPRFLKERFIQSAVIREIAVIGEAAKNVSAETRKRHGDIPWKKLSGMRDKLIHAYFAVDLTLVWDTIKQEMPKLKAEIIQILRHSSEE